MRILKKINQVKGKMTMRVERVNIYESIEHWDISSC